jgi:polyvinyl alcohol dehydrogenase (cytochrome)
MRNPIACRGASALGVLVAMSIVFTAPSRAAAPTPDGAALYAQRCATCHDKGAAHVPSRESLGNRNPINIVMTLMTGAMRPQAAGLTTEQARAIAAYLTADAASHRPALRPNPCEAPARPLALSPTGWNGWSVDTTNSRFQPHPGLSAADVPRLKLKWAFAYPANMTWGQPTVLDGRVFVTSTTGQVYALDASSGCTQWSFDAGAPVRTALSIGRGNSEHAAIAYFGDISAVVHAVDANTGQEIWRVRVAEHPLARITGAPVLSGDRLLVPVSSFEEGAAAAPGYACCTFRGSVVALDALTGRTVWERSTVEAEPHPYRRKGDSTRLFGPAGASVWNTPTLDRQRGLLYVGTGNDYTDISAPTTDAVVAIGLADGKIRWSRQLASHDNWASGCTFGGPCPKPAGTDADIAASVILVNLPSGQHVLVAGQKSGVVYGLDPGADGKVLWHVKVGGGGVFGGIEWGMAAIGSTVFVPISDSLTNTDDAARPGLAAIDAASGKQLWFAAAPEPACSWGKEDCRASLSQAISTIPGIVFAGSQDGHLRAYRARDGQIVWELDTAQPVRAVNAASARGGSLDSGGPVIAAGVLYVNSGYGQFLGHGGNVLLALSVDGN